MLNRFQYGKNLVEMLVAVTIVSVGVIGISRLQINSMRTTLQSQFRSVATIHAREIIERIRHNASRVAEYEHEIGDVIEAESVSTCGPNKNCTESNLSNYDKYIWLNSIAESLPLGKASLDCAATGVVHACEVTVYWKVVEAEDVTNTSSCGVPDEVAGGDVFDCVSLDFRVNEASS